MSYEEKPSELKGVSVRLPVEEKQSIEDFFLANRIKKYQDGYLQAIRLGIIQMEKIFKNKKGGGK